jgi:O-antigen/teichoic acid export membrane protein
MIAKNTDNVLLSAMFGISTVASYSNYTLISGSVHQLLTKLINGISAGVGNIRVTESKEKTEAVFDLVLFVTCWLFGFGAAALFILLEPFIRLSFGSQYLLPQRVVFLLCLNFYLNGVRKASLIFRDSLGLFRRDRYKTLAEGIVNLIASILFASRLGLAGVLAGTTFSYVSVSLWIEPLVLYREYFKRPTGGYFKKLLLYSMTVAAAGAAAWAVCRLIPDVSFWSMLGKAGLCALVTNGLLLLAAWKRPELRALKKALRNR